VATEKLIERLKEKLAGYEREFRVEVPERIRHARELGDLRESGEYETAKDRQGFLQAQISHLQKRISELSNIDLSQVPRDRVAFGATIYLEDEQSGEEKVYRLVAAQEVDTAKGWISAGSPVGQALIGKREGDSVVIRVPSGTSRYSIARLVTLHDLIEEETEEPHG